MTKYDSSKFQGRVRKLIQKRFFLAAAFDLGFPIQAKDDVLEVLNDLNLFYDEIAEDTITATYKRTFLEKIGCLLGKYTKGKPIITGIYSNLVIPEELNNLKELPMNVEYISISRNATDLLTHYALR